MARNSCSSFATDANPKDCSLPSRRPSGVAADRRTGSDPQPNAPKLEQRRGEILRGLFPKLTSWLETAAERARRRDIEDYLSRAADVCDLEERIRRLERRAGRSAFH